MQIAQTGKQSSSRSPAKKYTEVKSKVKANLQSQKQAHTRRKTVADNKKWEQDLLNGIKNGSQSPSQRVQNTYDEQTAEMIQAKMLETYQQLQQKQREIDELKKELEQKKMSPIPSGEDSNTKGPSEIDESRAVMDLQNELDQEDAGDADFLTASLNANEQPRFSVHEERKLSQKQVVEPEPQIQELRRCPPDESLKEQFTKKLQIQATLLEKNKTLIYEMINLPNPCSAIAELGKSLLITFWGRENLNWSAVQQALKNINLPQFVYHFDLDSFSETRWKALQPYLRSSDSYPENIKQKSIVGFYLAPLILTVSLYYQAVNGISAPVDKFKPVLEDKEITFKVKKQSRPVQSAKFNSRPQIPYNQTQEIKTVLKKSPSKVETPSSANLPKTKVVKVKPSKSPIKQSQVLRNEVSARALEPTQSSSAKVKVSTAKRQKYSISPSKLSTVVPKEWKLLEPTISSSQKKKTRRSKSPQEKLVPQVRYSYNQHQNSQIQFKNMELARSSAQLEAQFNRIMVNRGTRTIEPISEPDVDTRQLSQTEIDRREFYKVMGEFYDPVAMKRHESPTMRLIAQKNSTTKHKQVMSTKLSHDREYNIHYTSSPGKSYKILPKGGQLPYELAYKDPNAFYDLVMQQEIVQHKVTDSSSPQGKHLVTLSSKVTVRKIGRILSAVLEKLYEKMRKNCDVKEEDLKSAFESQEVRQTVYNLVKQKTIQLVDKDSEEPVFQKEMQLIGDKGDRVINESPDFQEDHSTIKDPNNAKLDVNDLAYEQVKNVAEDYIRRNSKK